MEKEQIYIGEIGKHIMLKPIDKQEAIEKMAKAICETGSNDTWDVVEQNYRNFCIAMAKNALNALLGDK